MQCCNILQKDLLICTSQMSLRSLFGHHWWNVFSFLATITDIFHVSLQYKTVGLTMAPYNWTFMVCLLLPVFYAYGGIQLLLWHFYSSHQFILLLLLISEAYISMLLVACNSQSLFFCYVYTNKCHTWARPK